MVLFCPCGCYAIDERTMEGHVLDHHNDEVFNADMAIGWMEKKIVEVDDEPLAEAWKIRCRLREEANKLYARSAELRIEGDKHYVGELRTHAEGIRLYAEADKTHAEGLALYAAGNRKWAEAVLKAHGNVVMDWKSIWDCVVVGVRYMGLKEV